MSAKKPPVDPFGGGERTIIRPNPGGRRNAPSPANAPPAQQQPPGAVPPPSGIDDWMGDAPQPSQQPVPYPPPPQAPYPAPQQQAPYQPAAGQVPPQGAGLGVPGQAPPQEAGLGVPGQALQDQRRGVPPPSNLSAANRVDVPNDNIITRSAGPLLLLLSHLRVAVSTISVGSLMEQVAQAITDFERDVLAAGVPPDQAQAAKYALCATADDIVQNIPGTERHLWTQYSMLSRFFQVRTSGVGFYDELGKFKSNPALYYDMLELMHACLSLGFEGQYRTTSGGDVTLQQIRRDVYHTLRQIKARVTDEISVHWRGQDIKLESQRYQLPVAAVASVALLTILGIFVALRFLLSGSSDALAGTMIEVHPRTEVAIARERYEPLPTPVAERDVTQLQRIRTALAEEISAQQISIDLDRDFIVHRLLSNTLFAAGSDQIKEGFGPILDKVAKVLNAEPGQIHVIGHTDNTPLKSRVRFKSNHHLSVKRAESVSAILSSALSDAARITTDGRGSDQPIASNKTRAGRAQNRRVEILLQSEE